MKVEVRFTEGPEEEHMTLRITLPKKWRSGPAQRIKETFLEAYNKKKEKNLDPADFHLQTVMGKLVHDDAVVEEHLEKRDTVLVKAGGLNGGSGRAGAKAAGGASGSSGAGAEDGTEKCRNYGCGQRFREAENSAEACLFHPGPPIFHETRKGWQCCNRVVYDWDEFMKIEGCTRGKHSTVDPQVQFAVSPTVAAAAEAGGSATEADNGVAQSIDAYNAANQDAPTSAASAAAAAGVGTKREGKILDDGRHQCIHHGCQSYYRPEENGDAACKHHKEAPMFHDRLKWWRCCPHRKVTEWDDFMAIEGCEVGPHSDGRE